MLAEENQLQHDLHPHFPLLGQFHSTKSLERSALYQELRPRILKVLNGYEMASPLPAPEPEPYYRVLAWNIERGICFDEIVHFLKNHPLMATADLLLLTETDLGMARSGNRNIAQELARILKMNYLFVPSYLNLSKGCGIEQEMDGDNTLGIHGNAILSRYPLHQPRIVPLPKTHDKMKGREKRLGNQRAVLATVEFPGHPLRTACVHLDMRSTQNDRKRQMEGVLRAFQSEGQSPVLIGGDWNTSTYDSHSSRSAIIGFWVRVMIGVTRSIRSHYLHPYSFFEKKLFRMLEREGFDYKECNELGVGTVHYRAEDMKANKNLNEWVPDWCFQFIRWALRKTNGECPFKLDWFAQKGLKILSAGKVTSPRKGPSINPQVIGDLVHNGQAASDHDAIVVDFCY